eukprot:5440555-Pleurochrysis_carterae.AAC.1
MTQRLLLLEALSNSAAHTREGRGGKFASSCDREYGGEFKRARKEQRLGAGWTHLDMELWQHPPLV